MEEIMHKHHIIPRHMGGTDDPDNLIDLTVEEHAESHRKLFEEHGKWQDYMAWQGLSGLISKEELVKQIQSEAAKERLETYGNPFSGIKTKGNFSINEEHREYASELSKTPEAIAKRKKTMAERGHQLKEKNSQAGTKWYVEENSVDLSSRKKFRDAPEGWITTSEWRDRKKNKFNNAYGRHWYNNGTENFYLKESDSLTEKLVRGRLIVVN